MTLGKVNMKCTDNCGNVIGCASFALFFKSRGMLVHRCRCVVILFGPYLVMKNRWVLVLEQGHESAKS